MEQWSKEHPPVRNVDHVAEGLEKLGFRVDKNKMTAYSCPAPYSAHFGESECPEVDNCESCRKWWLEEYKGEDKGEDISRWISTT